MATRYYFSAATTSPLTSLAFNADWEATAEATRVKLLSAADGADTIAQGPIISWNAGQEALDRQYVSDRIGATTIDGTVKCQIKSRSLAGNDNARTRLCIYVVSEDGSTVRGVLFAVATYGPATNIASAGTTNKTYADGDTVTSVSAQNGDRIVVEVGYSDASGTTPQARSLWGSSAGADLPEDETTVTAANAWIEFSNTMAPYQEPATYVEPSEPFSNPNVPRGRGGRGNFPGLHQRFKRP